MKSRSITILIFSLLLSTKIFGQASENQSWMFLNFDYKISDNNLAAIQLWDRNYYNEPYNRHLYFANVAYNHTHSERTHYLLGIINQFDVREEVDGIDRDITKDRYTVVPWQGISYDFLHLGKAKFGSLTRIEERFTFLDFIDFDMRFRERLQVRYPIVKNLNFRATSEIIFNVNDDNTKQLFYADQLRTFVGINYKFFDKFKVELDYGIFHRRLNSSDFDFGFSTNMFLLSVDYILTHKDKDHEHHDKRHY